MEGLVLVQEQLNLRQIDNAEEMNQMRRGENSLEKVFTRIIAM